MRLFSDFRSFFPSRLIVGLLVLMLPLGVLLSLASCTQVAGSSYSGSLPSPQMAPSQAASQVFTTDDFVKRPENKFQNVRTQPLSTFSTDVDTASYALVRQALDDGRMPHNGTVRIEEMVNYFPYHDAGPKGHDPVAVTAELTPAVWAPDHRVLRIGLKAREIDWSTRKPSNLVFLIDTSGSMYGPEKLGLVKTSMTLLSENLDKRDTVTIVTYAGSAGVALPPTRGDKKDKILAVLDELEAGGGTRGSAGIKTAYDLARKNFIEDGINRVILCTDGDFNLGVTSKAGLLDLIKDEARSGVFLTVLGYGMGNYKDDQMMQLADSGNGAYAYIDSALEAKRVLVEQVGSSLITVAKDVKVQVEFNPQKVASYRLIGYEKRVLEARDFKDDARDAGEMGAGHTVTALYEIVPAGLGERGGDVAPLKYATEATPKGNHGDEWATVKVRYKDPSGSTGREMSIPVQNAAFTKTPSPDTRFAMAVAAFGMVLSQSEHKGTATYDQVLSIVSDPSVSSDVYRKEFVGLVAKAKRISGEK